MSRANGAGIYILPIIFIKTIRLRICLLRIKNVLGGSIFNYPWRYGADHRAKGAGLRRKTHRNRVCNQAANVASQFAPAGQIPALRAAIFTAPFSPLGVMTSRGTDCRAARG